ncbi:MAG: DUF1592 domain-containing protein [Pseudomonadota bacterium]
MAASVFGLASCVGVIGGHQAGASSSGSTAPSGAGGGPGSGAGGSTGVAAGATGAVASGGTAGTASTVTASDAPTTFACDPTLEPPVAELRALTTAQVQNTLADLVSWALKSTSLGATAMNEAAGAMAALPDNAPVVPTNDSDLGVTFPDGGWLRADQDQQFTRVQAFYGIGQAVAKSLTSSASRLGAVVGTCATDSSTANDATCLTTFIQTFGARALRRPLTPDEITSYTGVYGTTTTADAAAYADVITVMLNSPDFLYFVEHGGDPVAGQPGVYALSAYELASRLAYHLWDTMPDDELWQAAASGSLLQASVYQAEVDRLFASPRARAVMRRFFEDYVQVNGSGGPRGTGGLNYHDLTARVSTPAFTAFAGANVPTAATYANMVDDAVGMLDYYAWTAPGTIHDLLTSSLSFAKTADLAGIYGIATWDGMSAPPSFPTGQRPGLFTRALFVAAGVETAPILKGVFLRRYVLCDTIGRPPPQAANVVVTPSTTQTTRQVTTAVTASAACSGCHASYINPLEFATEGFDGLGRVRAQEALYKPDGTVAARLPVDTTGAPHVFMGDATTPATGPADLMRIIDASNKPAACLARNYFRYTFGRFEDLSLDGCSLEAVRSKLDGGGHLMDMLKAVTMTPAFKNRAFQ